MGKKLIYYNFNYKLKGQEQVSSVRAFDTLEDLTYYLQYKLDNVFVEKLTIIKTKIDKYLGLVMSESKTYYYNLVVRDNEEFKLKQYTKARRIDLSRVNIRPKEKSI